MVTLDEILFMYEVKVEFLVRAIFRGDNVSSRKLAIEFRLHKQDEASFSVARNMYFITLAHQKHKLQVSLTTHSI